MAELSAKPDDPTGLTTRFDKGQSVPARRPATLAWITDDMLTRTKNIWSKYYERPVDDDEAIEILNNVKRLARALAKALEEKES